MKQTIEELHEKSKRELAWREAEDSRARAAYEASLTPQQIAAFLTKEVARAKSDTVMAADLLSALLRFVNRHDLAQLSDHIKEEMEKAS